AGLIPATDANLACTLRVARYLAKLDSDVTKCHIKAAREGIFSRPFDEEACEETDSLRSALAKYNVRVQRLITAGLCPPCLADPPSSNYAPTQGSNLVTDLDQLNGQIFLCP